MMLDMKMRIQFEELCKLGEKRINYKKQQALKNAGTGLKAIEEQKPEKKEVNFDENEENVTDPSIQSKPDDTSKSRNQLNRNSKLMDSVMEVGLKVKENDNDSDQQGKYQQSYGRPKKDRDLNYISQKDDIYDKFQQADLNYGSTKI